MIEILVYLFETYGYADACPEEPAQLARKLAAAGFDEADIKAAVELMFEVKVADVQVANEPGKVRRFGKTPGRTQDWKKAYVRLAPGQTIDYEASRKA